MSHRTVHIPVKEISAGGGTSKLRGKLSSAISSASQPSIPTKPTLSRRALENESAGEKVNVNHLLTKRDICEAMLADGFVQSYVDFYHLTHRIDPNTCKLISVCLVVLTQCPFTVHVTLNSISTHNRYLYWM